MLPHRAPITHLFLLQGQPGRKGFPGRPGPDGLKVRGLGSDKAEEWEGETPGEERRERKSTYEAPGRTLDSMASCDVGMGVGNSSLFISKCWSSKDKGQHLNILQWDAPVMGHSAATTDGVVGLYSQEVPVGVVGGGRYESAPYGLSRGRDQVHHAPGYSEQRLACGQVTSGR